MKHNTGYRSHQVPASWPAIKEASVEFENMHGRWPTHYAVPRQGASKELIEHLAGSSLREMSGIVGQGSSIILGFDRAEHLVRREPSWMQEEFFEEPEVEIVVAKKPGLLEEAGVAASLEKAKDEVDEFFDDLQKASEPIVIMNEADVIAHFGRQ